MANTHFRTPGLSEQQVLDQVHVRLLAPGDESQRERFRELIEKHHDLKSDILRFNHRLAFATITAK